MAQGLRKKIPLLVTVTDAETMQVVGKTGLKVVVAKRENGFGRNWKAVSGNGDKLARDKRKILGVDGLGVLHHVLYILDYENNIPISMAEAAREMDMTPSNVSRAMKRLIDLDIVIKTKKPGYHATYTLNPEYAWRGSGKNHQEALRIQFNKRHREKLQVTECV